MKVPIPWTPLYQSQRSGTISVQRAFWRGEQCEFRVQWHEDRVYFRLADMELKLWASLESCAEEDAIACFHRATKEKHYGACFEQDVNVFHGGGVLSFRLQFIYAPDGTGLLREWCSRDWIAFSPKETRAWAFFPELHLPQMHAEESRGCCIYAAKSVREQIMFRRASDEEIERLSWRCATNQAEFEQTMRLLWNAGLLMETEQKRAFHYAGASMNNSPPFVKSGFHLSGAQCGDALKRWLQTYFRGEGFERKSRNWGQRRYRRLRTLEPNLRAFFEWNPIRWSINFGDWSVPSLHQQIEARLQLRDWLSDKASPAQINELLS